MPGVVVILLAIIWGYDANEITDGIILLREGVSFGEVRLSLGDVATFAAVFFIGYFVTRWLQRFLKISVMPEFGMEAGAQAAILTFIGYIGIFLAVTLIAALAAPAPAPPPSPASPSSSPNAPKLPSPSS